MSPKRAISQVEHMVSQLENSIRADDDEIQHWKLQSDMFFEQRKHVVRQRWHHGVTVNVFPSTSVGSTFISQAPKDITMGKPREQFNFPCLSWNWKNDCPFEDAKNNRKCLKLHGCLYCISKGSYAGHPSINCPVCEQAPKPTAVRTISAGAQTPRRK